MQACSLTSLSADPGRTSRLHPAPGLRLACPVFLGPVSREQNSLLSSEAACVSLLGLPEHSSAHWLAPATAACGLTVPEAGTSWCHRCHQGWLAPSQAVREGLIRPHPQLLGVGWRLWVPWFLLASPPSGSRGVPLLHIYLCVQFCRTLAMLDREPLYARMNSS